MKGHKLYNLKKGLQPFITGTLLCYQGLALSNAVHVFVSFYISCPNTKLCYVCKFTLLYWAYAL